MGASLTTAQVLNLGMALKASVCGRSCRKNLFTRPILS